MAAAQTLGSSRNGISWRGDAARQNRLNAQRHCTLKTPHLASLAHRHGVGRRDIAAIKLARGVVKLVALRRQRYRVAPGGDKTQWLFMHDAWRGIASTPNHFCSGASSSAQAWRTKSNQSSDRTTRNKAWLFKRRVSTLKLRRALRHRRRDSRVALSRGASGGWTRRIVAARRQQRARSLAYRALRGGISSRSASSSATTSACGSSMTSLRAMRTSTTRRHAAAYRQNARHHHLKSNRGAASRRRHQSSGAAASNRQRPLVARGISIARKAGCGAR